MEEKADREYRVISLGSTMKSPKDEELEAALNGLAVEGWEVISVFPYHGTNKVTVISKRAVTAAARRQRSWPG